MRTTAGYEQTLFPDVTAEFPSTRYQGSKAKLVERIWERIAHLDFSTCLDAFGGTGAVSFRLKKAGKQATYNDALRFNYYIGLALIENTHVRLSYAEVDRLLQRHPGMVYPCIVQDNFHDIYFTDEENAWIDQTVTNVRQLADPYKLALALFALCQACMVKRPYNLFHRKNLYLRLSEVERSFGNKATWDKPFDEWFRLFVQEANHAVFDNGRINRALNLDACEVPGEYDLVYVDTPYISKHGAAVDYLDFYHFLEGLTIYETWDEQIDRSSKHRRLKPRPSEWSDRRRISDAFERLFRRYQDSILVVSYRGDGIPSEPELVALLKRYKRTVHVEHFGQYKYALSTNAEANEILLIGT